jgi:hypothetical protein
MSRLEAFGNQLAPHQIQTELDTLAALLETHFTYEERKITAALNALTTSSEEDRNRLSRPFRRTGSS